MRRLIEPWTAEDEERLRALVAQGASIVRASAAIRRRKVVVRERAKKLGCPFPTLAAARRKWADSPNNYGETEIQGWRAAASGSA
jgi:hypothetical protein